VQDVLSNYFGSLCCNSVAAVSTLLLQLRALLLQLWNIVATMNSATNLVLQLLIEVVATPSIIVATLSTLVATLNSVATLMLQL